MRWCIRCTKVTYRNNSINSFSLSYGIFLTKPLQIIVQKILICFIAALTIALIQFFSTTHGYILAHIALKINICFPLGKKFARLTHHYYFYFFADLSRFHCDIGCSLFLSGDHTTGTYRCDLLIWRTVGNFLLGSDRADDWFQRKFFYSLQQSRLISVRWSLLFLLLFFAQ